MSKIEEYFTSIISHSELIQDLCAICRETNIISGSIIAEPVRCLH